MQVFVPVKMNEPRSIAAGFGIDFDAPEVAAPAQVVLAMNPDNIVGKVKV